jgi:hypothetical protein
MTNESAAADNEAYRRKYLVLNSQDKKELEERTFFATDLYQQKQRLIVVEKTELVVNLR